MFLHRNTNSNNHPQLLTRKHQAVPSAAGDAVKRVVFMFYNIGMFGLTVHLSPVTREEFSDKKLGV